MPVRGMGSVVSGSLRLWLAGLIILGIMLFVLGMK